MVVNSCPHCQLPLVVKQTKSKPSQLTKSYYYSAYFSCTRCGRMYFDEKFKVTNTTTDLFSENVQSVDPVDSEIWTDGACVFNGQEHAKAAWGFVSGSVEKAGTVDGKQTNNRAEAQAILEALQWAGKKGERRVRIFSDSLITIQNLKKPIEKILANKDIFEKIFEVIKKYSLEVQYEKVLGHSGIEENERVDKVANDFARQLV